MSDSLIFTKLFKVQPPTNWCCCKSYIGFLIWFIIAFALSMYGDIRSFVLFGERTGDKVCDNYGDYKVCQNAALYLASSILSFILSITQFGLVVIGYKTRNIRLVNLSLTIYLIFYVYSIAKMFGGLMLDLSILPAGVIIIGLILYLIVWIVMDYYLLLFNSFKIYISQSQNNEVSPTDNQNSAYQAFV
jgi:hypothetical protein